MENSINHYGVTVSKDTPITGVITNNQVEYLGDEILEGIRPLFEEHCQSCKNEYHDICWEDQDSDPIYIGFKRSVSKDGDQVYVLDPEAEYSAIVGEIYTQVLASKWGIKCALCSPCYPGQGDLEADGEFTAFCLPADLLGISFEGVEEIFEIKGEVK